MSLIFKNSIFNHIPKTGGSYIEVAIKNSGIKYQKLGHTHQSIYSPNKLVFCFIRNPLDWYVSRWRCPWHRKRIGGKYHHDARHIDANSDAEDFNRWLKRIIHISPNWLKVYDERYNFIKNWPQNKIVNPEIIDHRQGAQVKVCRGVAYNHHLLYGGKLFQDCGHTTDRIKGLSAVRIAVGHEQLQLDRALHTGCGARWAIGTPFEHPRAAGSSSA